MVAVTEPSISDFISDWSNCQFGSQISQFWEATARAEELIAEELGRLGSDYRRSELIAIHETATVEENAVIKGPAIIGPQVFVAANAYLRGGVFLEKGCIVGPSCELKTTFMFADSKVAHLGFVGDSIVGSKANIEAGAIIANYRNERDDKRIRIEWNGKTLETGLDKLGALIGDGVKVGANAVVAPGALLEKQLVVPRLALVDQSPPNNA